jgi:hypothetical protein
MDIQEKINKLIEDFNKQKLVGFDIDAEKLEDINTNIGFMMFSEENADFEVVDFIFEQKLFDVFYLYLHFKNINVETLRKWHSYYADDRDSFYRSVKKTIIFKDPVLFEKYKPILAEKRLKSFN